VEQLTPQPRNDSRLGPASLIEAVEAVVEIAHPHRAGAITVKLK
jgi:hypothetical protein